MSLDGLLDPTHAGCRLPPQVAELHRQLAPHLLRRLKKDVLTQLPPKMEQMVRLEMSDEQRQLYKAILAKNYEALVGESDQQEAKLSGPLHPSRLTWLACGL